MNLNRNSQPLACNLAALTPLERESHQALTARLFRSAEPVDRRSDGLVLHLANDTATLLHVAEFIANEQRCCPFITFGTQVRPQESTLFLSLTGNKATASFIKAEFAELLERRKS